MQDLFLSSQFCKKVFGAYNNRIKQNCRLKNRIMKLVKKRIWIIIAIALIVLAVLLWLAWTYLNGRNGPVWQFILDPEAHQDWVTPAGYQCQDAPFSIPTDGFIGYLYGDVFQVGKRHQGIDIFAGTESGVTPVYAPYDGYLTREESWKSTIIIRVPQDPLQPDRQIWIYMTHLADRYGNSLIDELFPPGAKEIPVKQGQILGYQGDYSGNPDRPVGVHLHLSIVKDDGAGNYLNELVFSNTLDPSPYFGMYLNAKTALKGPPRCIRDTGVD